MGAWFGSIHVRTDDVSTVRAALEQVAALLKAKFLVAPAINGWVSVFPHQNGQDQKVTETLTAMLPALHIVHVVLADDDVFAYGFLRGGQIVDEYVSKPDYFERVSAATREKQRGRPEHFEHLITPPNTLADVQRVLDDRDGDARTQFDRFAELLNLPNAATAYEYLNDGETDGVEAFARFAHVPDRAGERQAKRERDKAIKNDVASLQKAGVLLLDEGRRKATGAMFAPSPVICAAPAENGGGRGGGDGFLVAWPEVRMVAASAATASTELFRYAAPWPVGGAATGIALDHHVHTLRASPSGRYLAVGCASGRWEAELWDFHERRRLAVIPQPRAVEAICFSPDEGRLFLGSENQLTIVSVPEGEIVHRTTIVNGCRAIVHHPVEQMLVAIDGVGKLLLVDPQRGEVRKSLLIATDLAAAMASKLHVRVMEDGRGAEQIAAIAVARNGEQLLCATQSGVRVISWRAMQTATGPAAAIASIVAVAGGAGHEMPPAIHMAESEPIARDVAGFSMTMRGSYDVVYDEPRDRALFCGLEGRVRSLDLSSGAVGEVFDVPGRPPMYRLALSRDGSALACVEDPDMLERSGKQPRRLKIWRL